MIPSVDPRMGRRLPQDMRHEDLHPLRAVSPRTVEHVEDLLPLPYAYRDRYDQGSEGSCVGWAWTWALSIWHRRIFDALWLYQRAQLVDGWEDTPPEQGTSVRAGGDVLRKEGHRRIVRSGRPSLEPDLQYGFPRNVWADSVDEIRTAISEGIPVVLGIDWFVSFYKPGFKGRERWLQIDEPNGIAGGHAICCYGASDRRQAVRLTNSWGGDYPLVWLAYTDLERLLEGFWGPGEAAVMYPSTPPAYR